MNWRYEGRRRRLTAFMECWAPAIQGLRQLRERPLHAALNVVGVVAGTAGVVATLALGDGVSSTLEEQIRSGKIPSLVTARTQTGPSTVLMPDGEALRRLRSEFRHAGEISITLGARVPATWSQNGGSGVLLLTAVDSWEAGPGAMYPLLEGSIWDTGPDSGGRDLIVSTATLPAIGIARPSAAIARSVRIGDEVFTIRAVVKSPRGEGVPRAFVPFDNTTVRLLNRFAPYFQVTLKLRDGGATPAVEELFKRRVSAMLGGAQVGVTSTAQQVTRLIQSVRASRAAAATFASIALVVGAIGIANVLLMSVVDRTREIGVRRAVGATKRDIGVQFLTESLAIAVVGVAIGVVVGVAAAVVGATYVTEYASIPIRANLRGSTAVFVSGITLLLGVGAGAAPALRAAALDPACALRNE